MDAGIGLRLLDRGKYGPRPPGGTIGMAHMDTESQLAAVMERGAETGCIELSELSRLTEELALDHADVDALLERLAQQGIRVSDDCGREVPEPVTYDNDKLAMTTTDALSLFFRDVGPSIWPCPSAIVLISKFVILLYRLLYFGLALTLGATAQYLRDGWEHLRPSSSS